MKLLRTVLSAACVMGCMAAGSAQAALTSFQTFTGTYGVSTDGWGSSTQAGAISAFVPAGATVTAAYLYTSTFAGTGGIGGTLAGNAVNYSTLLGATAGLEAARADVTSIIKPLVDGGPGGTYNFNITESSFSQDGSALVVVYSLASLATSTVGILDGFSATTGDSTSINFSAPLAPAAPGFFAEMRLGIGFSFDGSPCGASSSQTSTVDVNGVRITNNAGCNDDSADAAPANGNLITVGGSDDPFSPLLPTVAQDHERYNLAGQIDNGDTSITVNTRNPSNDDNIFLAVFHVSGEARFNNTVPEPLSLSLVGLGLLGMGLQRKMKAAR
jgi:PEP-CTERM motif